LVATLRGSTIDRRGLAELEQEVGVRIAQRQHDGEIVGERDVDDVGEDRLVLVGAAARPPRARTQT
jgi:hypothetical protein